MFAINSFMKSNTKIYDQINLINLKNNLLKLDFQNSISIKCKEDNFECFIYKDGITTKEEIISTLFTEKPRIYSYSQKLEIIEFEDIEFEELESYKNIFEFSCQRDGKCDELIIEVSNKVYILNNLSKEPKIVDYINDVNEYFQNKIEKVKYAF
jgi:hypothetical protein